MVGLFKCCSDVLFLSKWAILGQNKLWSDSLPIKIWLCETTGTDIRNFWKFLMCFEEVDTVRLMLTGSLKKEQINRQKMLWQKCYKIGGVVSLLCQEKWRSGCKGGMCIQRPRNSIIVLYLDLKDTLCMQGRLDLCKGVT